MNHERRKSDYYRPFLDECSRLNIRLPVPTSSRKIYARELDEIETYVTRRPGEGDPCAPLSLSCSKPGRIVRWGYRFMRVRLSLASSSILSPVEVYLDADHQVLVHSAPVFQISGTDVTDVCRKIRMIRKALLSGKVLRRPQLVGFFEVDQQIN